jgi:stress-induced morphogen
MSQTTAPRWESLKTDQSRQVEAALRPHYPRTDAYRYNSASIRVRVIDPRFEGLSLEERDALVEPYLKQLPEEIQDDIMNLLTVTPEEIEGFSRQALLNLEFEDPSRSMV